MKAKQFLRKTLKGVNKHLPEVLMGLGVSGVFVTAGLAIYGTKSALDHIQDAKDDKFEKTGNSKLTKKEAFKACAKDYIPAAIAAICTTGCTVCAFSEEARKVTALTVGYQAAVDVIKDRDALIEKYVDAIGPKKSKAIEEEYLNEKGSEMETEGIVETSRRCHSDEVFLFKDLIQQREFYSTVSDVDKAVYEFKSEALDNMYGDNALYIDDDGDFNHLVPLNDWNRKLGITHSELGDILHWKKRDLDVFYVKKGASIGSDGRPCYTISYPAPIHIE